MKKIVLFNHKGGVSKTTTSFHIGWKLAEMGHRTLLVDGDPQCNLTSLFLGAEGFDRYFTEEATSNKNIKDGVAPVFEGQPIQIQAFKCPYASRNRNLYLLPGHMNLSEYEANLSFALGATSVLSALKNLPGAYNHLIETICEQYDIEYAIIDLNPALSALNQVLFLSADAFVIPLNPDCFAKMALKSLSTILPSWVNWSVKNRDMYDGAAYCLPSKPPRFVGVIPQRFNIRNGKPTTAYAIQISELLEIVKSDVVPSFARMGMTFSTADYEAAGIPENRELMEIKDFQGLSPKSQKYSVPVYALTDAELEAQGAALKVSKSNRKEFGQMYEEICKKIELLPI